MYYNFINYLYPLKKIYNTLISSTINYKYASKINPSVSESILIAYNKSRLKGPKEIICNAPFKHMYFKADGRVTACCRNDIDLFGIVKDATLADLWNSKSIEFLRDNIKDYNLKEGCNFCNTQLESSNFNAFEGRLYDDVLPVSSKKYPSEMTFEISNQCNLECIMCDGNYSSSIRMNREKLPPLQNHYTEDFINIVKEGIPYLKVVRFLGGEPFLITLYIEIIELIIAINPDCKIYIQTNGTILNNRVKKIISHKNIHLSISIDSLQKDLYQTIRKNASYERLMEHVNYFIESQKKYKNTININFCVMTNNWSEVINMLKFCNSNNFTLTYIPVEFPRYLSLRSLNSIALNEVLTYYLQPERQLILKENKLNGEKLTHLINYIKYCIEKVGILQERANNLYSYDIAFLSNELSKHLNKIEMSTVSYNKIKDMVFSTGLQMTEREQSLFLGILIIDLETNSNETPIYHYKDSVEWYTLFTEYLANLSYCNNKNKYL